MIEQDIGIEDDDARAVGAQAVDRRACDIDALDRQQEFDLVELGGPQDLGIIFGDRVVPQQPRRGARQPAAAAHDEIEHVDLGHVPAERAEAANQPAGGRAMRELAGDHHPDGPGKRIRQGHWAACCGPPRRNLYNCRTIAPPRIRPFHSVAPL